MNKLILTGALAILASCATIKIPAGAVDATKPVIVYKTRSNYNNYVPVTMDPSREAIVAYPAPGDLYYNGELAKPLKLRDGYLLDRRGMGPYSVITSFTYEAYASLGEAPGLQQLNDSIVDRTPFLELYDCTGVVRGSSGDLGKELDAVIESGFAGCKSLLK